MAISAQGDGAVPKKLTKYLIIAAVVAMLGGLAAAYVLWYRPNHAGAADAKVSFRFDDGQRTVLVLSERVLLMGFKGGGSASAARLSWVDLSTGTRLARAPLEGGSKLLAPGAKFFWVSDPMRGITAWSGFGAERLTDEATMLEATVRAGLAAPRRPLRTNGRILDAAGGLLVHGNDGLAYRAEPDTWTFKALSPEAVKAAERLGSTAYPGSSGRLRPAAAAIYKATAGYGGFSWGKESYDFEGQPLARLRRRLDSVARAPIKVGSPYEQGFLSPEVFERTAGLGSRLQIGSPPSPLIVHPTGMERGSPLRLVRLSLAGNEASVVWTFELGANRRLTSVLSGQGGVLALLSVGEDKSLELVGLDESDGKVRWRYEP